MKMKVEEKRKAREMRENGESLKVIARELDVSKASVSKWIKDIELTDEQKQNLLDRSKLWAYNNGQKKKHEELRSFYQNIGKEKIRKGNYSSLYIAGCMLYWAEGFKSKNKNTVNFSNSDFNMLKLFIDFLRSNFEVDNNEFRIKINCYLTNGLKQEDVENYWLKGLQLNRENLGKTQVNNFPSSSKGYRKNILKYGTCSLVIYRTDILQEIYGAIQEYGQFINESWLG